jgi:predicted DNA-binding transcriptional regulator AlpA
LLLRELMLAMYALFVKVNKQQRVARIKATRTTRSTKNSLPPLPSIPPLDPIPSTDSPRSTSTQSQPTTPVLAAPPERRLYSGLRPLSPAELAKFLGVSLSTVRRMYVDGDLPSKVTVKCAGRVRFIPSLVVEHLLHK